MLFRSGYVCVLTISSEIPGKNTFYWFQWGLRFVLTLTMGVCYIAIFCIAYMNDKKSVRMEKHLQNPRRSTVYNRTAKVKHRSLQQLLKDHKSDVKVASTVSIVILAFVTSWVPSFIADMFYFRTVDLKELFTSYSPVSHAVFWAIYISPTLNPIIYAMHNTTIRRMIIRVIKKRTVYKTSTAHLMAISSTTGLGLRINTRSSNLDIVKELNPVQPFRRKASSVIQMMRIQKGTQW